MSELTEMTIAAQAAALAARRISAVELTDAYLAEIERREPTVGAYLTVEADAARAAARAVDEARARGEALSPYAGIPMALKDNICTRGVRTTCASRMLADFVPPYDAHVTERLAAAGCVLLGKLNMDEFAMGSSTENSAMHPTHNPADPARVPGGSSGGSAAAVAAREAAFTLGSDTGGSIRQPASFCGVVGMKPTYGTVSRYGLVAFASSLDQIGPLTRTVRDNAAVLNLIAGHDARDATSLDRTPDDCTAEIGQGVAGLRVGLPKEFFGEGLAPDVRAAVTGAVDALCRMGAVKVEVSMPALDYALAAYYVLSSAEASSNLARFDGVRYGTRAAEYEDIASLYCKTRSQGFGAEVKRRILLGTFALSSGYYDAYYKKAQQVRSLVRADFDRALEQCDVLAGPVAPTVAWRLGEKRDDPLEMYMGDVYSVPANVAGLPALSLPCGRGEGGLPVGLQLMGRPFSEPLLYRVGAAVEDEMGGVRA